MGPQLRTGCRSHASVPGLDGLPVPPNFLSTLDFPILLSAAKRPTHRSKSGTPARLPPGGA